ncbi:site-specific DNA-methyltransferase [Candidatus Calescamantes bacterium]|nr:site-specific DNA-methyltransferase [Candidatus Calescamantes bacterium]
MTLLEELKELLKEDARFVDSEGNLLKNKIVEHALKLDENLIELLLKNDKIKQHFFKNIDGVLVFDKEKFMKFIDNKEFLPDSYTAFKNKIGLANEEGEYLAKSKEVVLVWPYKDCVLEGGQEKPDEKRKEIFHNVILAPDEIDRLLEPKVFTNFKRIDKNGEHPLDGFRRDPEINRKRGLPEDTITDNLIIRGNNLLVLYSLLKEFRGKVKLIYIDPPYNTGNDEFQYNDNFKHSTWLTFMKNRLEVAKELLKEDGVIFVQIDNSPSTVNESPELGYLMVLIDEIFGRKNYITTVVWKKKSNPSNTEKLIGTITESILMYAKDITKVDLNLLEYKRQYKYRDEKGEYNLERPIKTDEGTYERGTMKYPVIDPTTGKEYYPPEGKRWTIGREKMMELIQEGKVVFINDNLYIKKYKDDYLRGDAKLFSNLLDNHGSLKKAKDELKALGFPREAFDSPKPEILIKTLIDMVVTNEKDIILDFFLGSGTTCAVAHKMKLQYIGVEQMDYVKTLVIERMRKVIQREQGGVSKEVSWQGGGDFAYMELMKLNEAFVEKIRDAETTEELLDIWEEMKYNGFLSYRVDPRLFDENIEEFKSLSVDEQKKLLLEMIEYNDLYVNYSEIDDATYNISEEDKKLNREFYKGGH